MFTQPIVSEAQVQEQVGVDSGVSSGLGREGSISWHEKIFMNEFVLPNTMSYRRTNSIIPMRERDLIAKDFNIFH